MPKQVVNSQPTYRQPQFERQGESRAPATYRFPRIIGGVCETCGILDKHRKSEEQYTLCPHFRNMGLIRCNYCDEAKNPVEVIRMSDMMVAVSPNSTPDNPKLLALCDSYECNKKHQAKYS